MRMSKKVLFPLATMAAAGVVAVGSGATFSSETNNTISAVTSGTLSQSNSKDGQAIFTLTDVKPGDTRSGSLTLKNTGSLPAAFSLTEVSSTNGFTADNLNLAITNATTGATVYTGTFGGLEDGVKQAIGTIEPGVTNTFTFTVKLDTATTNADQGKTAGATYTWNSVQLDGQSS